MAGTGIRNLKRKLQNFRKLYRRSVARNRKLVKLICAREKDIKEHLEFAQEARAIQDKKLGMLQCDLMERQAEPVKREDAHHVTKMEVKHMHQEYSRVKIKSRHRKLQIQEFHQTLNQITQEKDDAVNELWTVENQKWEEAHDYEVQIHDYEVDSQRLVAQIKDLQAQVQTLQTQLAEAQAHEADQYIVIEDDSDDGQVIGDAKESETDPETSDASPGPHIDSP